VVPLTTDVPPRAFDCHTDVFGIFSATLMFGALWRAPQRLSLRESGYFLFAGG
jgi:hypothetical protein